MQQLKFILENEDKTHPGLPISAEREKNLIELMAKAILAHLQQPPGEEDERT